MSVSIQPNLTTALTTTTNVDATETPSKGVGSLTNAEVKIKEAIATMAGDAMAGFLLNLRKLGAPGSQRKSAIHKKKKKAKVPKRVRDRIDALRTALSETKAELRRANARADGKQRKLDKIAAKRNARPKLLTAYTVYMSKNIEIVAASYPDLSPTERMKKVAEMWRQVDDAQRRGYEKMAADANLAARAAKAAEIAARKEAGVAAEEEEEEGEDDDEGEEEEDEEEEEDGEDEGEDEGEDDGEDEDEEGEEDAEDEDGEM